MVIGDCKEAEAGSGFCLFVFDTGKALFYIKKSFHAYIKKRIYAMNKAEILSFLKSQKNILMQKYGVKKIGIFGSVVRGDAKEHSDIDIAVELDEQHIFRNFFALEQYLKDNLHQNIDLGIESSLKPAVRERVLKEIVYV